MPPHADPNAITPIPEHPHEEVWIAHHLPGVRSLLQQLTKDADLANDLTQDVLIAALQAQREQRIREPGALVAYLHQTARNLAVMHARKARPESMPDLPDGETAWSVLQRSPQEHYESNELVMMARRVIDELPVPRDRELLIGFYVHDIDKQQLMQRFGLSREHFDRVIFRARSRMRELMDAKMRAIHETTTPADAASKNAQTR